MNMKMKMKMNLDMNVTTHVKKNGESWRGDEMSRGHQT
jgi:hypothetical protein